MNAKTADHKKADTKSKSAPCPCPDTHDDIPAVSKQTVGGIAGAVIGGLVAGPLGAAAVGVAGAMVGNASAAGHRPIEKTVDAIKDVTEEPLHNAYKSISNKLSHSKKKAPAKKKSAGSKKAT